MTIDAIACNPTIADVITGNGADFVLAVKENQPSLRGEIAAFFDATPAEKLPSVISCVTPRSPSPASKLMRSMALTFEAKRYSPVTSARNQLLNW